MQPIHLAAGGGRNEVIGVLINDYGVSAQTEVWYLQAYSLLVVATMHVILKYL